MSTYETNLNQDFDCRRNRWEKTSLLNPSANRKADYLSSFLRRFDFRKRPLKPLASLEMVVRRIPWACRFARGCMLSHYIFGYRVIFKFSFGFPDNSGHLWPSKPRPFCSSPLQLSPEKNYFRKISSVFWFFAQKGGHSQN